MKDVLDLLATLERIHEEASKARQRFAAGTLPNGRWALQTIENEASDALARFDERIGEESAA